MKILVVSLGSIGRKHIQNLRKIDPTIEICVWRHSSSEAKIGEIVQHVDKVVYSEELALDWKPEIALLTCPASLHVDVGLRLAVQGIHLFIEKPLSNSLNGIDELIERCSKRSLVLMVGYNFRFYQPLRVVKEAIDNGYVGRILYFRAEVGQYLPDWRPEKDYRATVSSQRKLGGGALLELSHELDYSNWLIGDIKSVYASLTHLSDLEIDVEDNAEVIVEFKNGVIGSIHMDMVQRVPRRGCTIIGSEGTLVWNWADHSVKLYSANNQEGRNLFEGASYDRNSMYIEEMQHFLDCVTKSQIPIIDGEAGRRVVKTILAAKVSAEFGRMVVL